MALRIWASARGSWVPGGGYAHAFHASEFTRIHDYLSAKGLNGVTELAICAHGKPGRIEKEKDQLWCDSSIVGNFKDELGELGKYLSAPAVVVFYSCTTGIGKEGDDFLARISQFLTGRRIVAFNTVLWMAGDYAQSQAGQVKDTGSHNEAMAERDPAAYRDTPNLTVDSRHAKHALNGKIVQRPKDEAVTELASRRLTAESDPGVWGRRNNYRGLLRILEERKQRGKLYAFPYKFPLWLDKEAWGYFLRRDELHLQPLLKARAQLGIVFEKATRH